MRPDQTRARFPAAAARSLPTARGGCGAVIFFECGLPWSRGSAGPQSRRPDRAGRGSYLKECTRAGRRSRSPPMSDHLQPAWIHVAYGLVSTSCRCSAIAGSYLILAQRAGTAGELGHPPDNRPGPTHAALLLTASDGDFEPLCGGFLSRTARRGERGTFVHIANGCGPASPVAASIVGGELIERFPATSARM